MKIHRKPSIRLLTAQQCAALQSVAESEVKGLALIGLTTGQRFGDIRVLKCRDVSLTRNTIRFSVAKAGATVEVPLASRVRAWIEERVKSSASDHPDTLLFPAFATGGIAQSSACSRKLVRKVGAGGSATSFRHMCAQRFATGGIRLPDQPD